jgi:hypothetical protein
VAHNGEICRESGVYRSICCGAEVSIVAGAAFPDCPKHPKLTTVWKSAVAEKVTRHIENRRLFNMAAGLIWLEPEEQDHLCKCKVCESVLFVLQKLPVRDRAA